MANAAPAATPAQILESKCLQKTYKQIGDQLKAGEEVLLEQYGLSPDVCKVYFTGPTEPQLTIPVKQQVNPMPLFGQWVRHRLPEAACLTGFSSRGPCLLHTPPVMHYGRPVHEATQEEVMFKMAKERVAWWVQFPLNVVASLRQKEKPLPTKRPAERFVYLTDDAHDALLRLAKKAGTNKKKYASDMLLGLLK